MYDSINIRKRNSTANSWRNKNCYVNAVNKLYYQEKKKTWGWPMLQCNVT